MPPLAIKDSWYKPKCRYFDRNGQITPKPKKKLYIGVELEFNLEGMQEREYALFDWRTNTPWMYAKEDWTTNEWGLEFVTHPFTYEWYIQHRYEILQSLDTLKECGAWTTEDLGLHVHLSRSSFTKEHLIRFQKFVYENKDFTVRVARRPKGILNSWAFLGETQEKIIRKSSLKYTKATTEEKNVAVNTCHKNSIEVRIFRSSLNRQKVFQSIEYCVAAFEYTKERKRTSVDGFWMWVQYHPARYPHLYLFMNNLANLEVL